MALKRRRRSVNAPRVAPSTSILLALLVPMAMAPMNVDGESTTGLFVNESFVAGLRRPLEVEDPMAVFRHVLGSLPDEAWVFPSEHYYYFGFTASGRRLAGNLRFAPDRDAGVVHFAYYDQDNTSWSRYRQLDAADGVQVQRVGDNSYRVATSERAVIFHLLMLDQTPPERLLRPWESFVGRSQDESGMRFFLLYNREQPHFLWVLDESDGVPWQVRPVEGGAELVEIGPARFLFYRDDSRHILVGVSSWSIEANDYFDGPFDQLPDDHLPDSPFSEWLQLAYPNLKGQVDAHGRFKNPDLRAAVNPYVTYFVYTDVIDRVHRCDTYPAGTARFYRCLCHDWKQGDLPEERK